VSLGISVPFFFFVLTKVLIHSVADILINGVEVRECPPFSLMFFSWPGKKEFDSSVSEQLSGELFLHQARLRSTLITVRFLAGGGLVLGGAKFSAHSG